MGFVTYSSTTFNTLVLNIDLDIALIKIHLDWSRSADIGGRMFKLSPGIRKQLPLPHQIIILLLELYMMDKLLQKLPNKTLKALISVE